MRTRRVAIALVVSTLMMSGCATGGYGDGEPVATPTVSESPEPSATPEPTETPAPVASIPTSCDLPIMLRVIRRMGFTGAVDVTPPWEPAKGTTLRLALDNGGRACAWGPPGTDAGVVVWWTPVTSGRWAKVATLAGADGASQLDIPGVKEDDAYFRFSPASDELIFPVWEMNALFGKLWIHVQTSSWVNPVDGKPVILKALAVAGL